MIAIGQWRFFETAPWILLQQGAVTEQPLSVAPWVPAEAYLYILGVPLMKAWADQWGNIDATALLRVVSGTDYAVIAEVGASKLLPGAMLESGGQTILVPNVNRQFLWLLAGNSLNAGANLTLALHGYLLP